MRAPAIGTLGMALVFAALGRAAPEVTVRPSTVRIGFFYSGAQMRIEGTAQPGTQVLIVLRGEDIEEAFNVKHRAGPIWLNSGSVRVSGVPSIFLRFTAAAVRDLLPRDVIDRYQLDIASIRHQMHIEPARDNLETLQESYLALKTEEGKYSIVRDAVREWQAADGRTAFRVEFPWPKKAPPGQYRLSVYEVSQGQVRGQTVRTLPVVMEGFPASLAALASQRSAIYGLAAVLAALLAGFGIDRLVTLMFGKKRAVGH